MHTIRERELANIEESQFRKRRKIFNRTSYAVTIVQDKEVCDTIISEIKRRFLVAGHLEMAN